MATITIYRQTLRDAACVNPADVEAFDAQFMRYVSVVGAAIDGVHSIDTDSRSQNRISYAVSDCNPADPVADEQNAHDVMQSIEFWNC